MGSYTGLPPVSVVLEAIESELSDANRALLGHNLTKRAFALGVFMALDHLYPESESKPLGKYLLKILSQTMLGSDPLDKTPSGKALDTFKGIVLEALVTRGSARVGDSGRALHDVLGDRLQHVSDTVHESQKIIATISTLVDTARSESGGTDMQRDTVRLLEVLRELIQRIETSGAENWFDN